MIADKNIHRRGRGKSYHSGRVVSYYLIGFLLYPLSVVQGN